MSRRLVLISITGKKEVPSLSPRSQGKAWGKAACKLQGGEKGEKASHILPSETKEKKGKKNKKKKTKQLKTKTKKTDKNQTGAPNKHTKTTNTKKKGNTKKHKKKKKTKAKEGGQTATQKERNGKKTKNTSPKNPKEKKEGKKKKKKTPKKKTKKTGWLSCVLADSFEERRGGQKTEGKKLQTGHSLWLVASRHMAYVVKGRKKKEKKTRERPPTRKRKGSASRPIYAGCQGEKSGKGDGSAEARILEHGMVEKKKETRSGPFDFRAEGGRKVIKISKKRAGASRQQGRKKKKGERVGLLY